MAMQTSSNLIGTRIGAYEVQTVLGSGGMATVYRAFDHNLHRPVALKVLSDGAAAQPGFAERFRQEARLIARLRHPHIVQVYDFGTQDQVVYMVQELLAGPTLAERLSEFAARGQPMPRREIATVLRQLADALDAAHAAGIIHRDVKPSNALYNADGALVLTDFGIAKNTQSDATQTAAGVVFGTPAYVSPEQARGEPLTPASDIYALGVVLYELIGGRPPFEGTTPLGIVLKHLQEPPPPLQPLRATLPPAVETVVRRALAKEPGERFASAGALAEAFERAWPGPAQPSAQPAAVHALPTSVWQPARPAAPPPAMSAAQHQPVAAQPIAAQPVTAQPGPATARPVLLPVLALLFVAVLAAGAFLALRGDPGQSSTPGSAPTSQAPATGDALAGVRAALGPALTAGLQAPLDTAAAALAAGDSATATEAMGQLQREILRARRSGTISAAAMRDALAELQRVAERNGLRLPLQVGE